MPQDYKNHTQTIPKSTQYLNAKSMQKSTKEADLPTTYPAIYPQKEVAPLLKCFEYLKPYYIDTLDVICVMLEIFLLKIKMPNDFTRLLNLDKIQARKQFVALLQSIIPSALLIDSKANIIKVLKLINQSNLKNTTIEEFLHLITQKKTSNKLYFYSTPSEINQLLVGILDIQDGEEVYNPCYGIGSVFLRLPKVKFKLYGEELDSKLSYLATLIARISGIKEAHLGVGDILTNPLFRNSNDEINKHNKNPNITQNGFIQFDKILCNPPLNAQMSVESLKDDVRFSNFLVKSYPELVFLTHSLAHLKHKGVFIVRNQTLLKSAIEGRLRHYLCENGLIEAIIELPKNIFPHQNYDFSLLVISKGNKEILHFNANNEHFYTKDGKYNRLKNIDKILEIYAYKKLTPHSALTPLNQISFADLRAQNYTNITSLLTPLSSQNLLTKDTSLKDLGVEVFRGQRVQGTKQDEPIEFYDIGIADFAICGWTQSFESKKTMGNVAKIYKYQVKPYDILLSLRGVSPKIAIVGEKAMDKKEVLQNKGENIISINKIPSVVNAGIIVLRAPSKQIAIGLYCYFFSTQGEEILAKLYKTNTDNTIDTQHLAHLRVPNDYDKNATQKIKKLDSAKDRIYAIEWEIQGIKDGK